MGQKNLIIYIMCDKYNVYVKIKLTEGLGMVEESEVKFILPSG